MDYETVRERTDFDVKCVLLKKNKDMLKLEVLEDILSYVSTGYSHISYLNESTWILSDKKNLSQLMKEEPVFFYDITDSNIELPPAVFENIMITVIGLDIIDTIEIV